MTVQWYRKNVLAGPEVQAVQVADELEALYEVAQWIHANGGRLTDPLHTFDSAFRIHSKGGDLAVHPGDYVVLSGNGQFSVATPDVFEATHEFLTSITEKE
jgi:hypothetical protein